MKKPEVDLKVVEAGIAMNLQKTALALRFQIVDDTQPVHRRTERTVHLTMTPDEAMCLLANLQKVQSTHSLPPGSRVANEQISVPPAKDRH